MTGERSRRWQGWRKRSRKSFGVGIWLSYSPPRCRKLSKASPSALPIPPGRLPKAALHPARQDHSVHRSRGGLVGGTDCAGVSRPTSCGGRFPPLEESSLSQLPTYLPLDRPEAARACLLLCVGTDAAQSAAPHSGSGWHQTQHCENDGPAHQDSRSYPALSATGGFAPTLDAYRVVEHEPQTETAGGHPRPRTLSQQLGHTSWSLSFPLQERPRGNFCISG